METKQKISIPLPHEVIRNQISQALHEFSVLQLHVLKPENTSSAEVLILMKDPKEAETLRARKWIAKAAAAQVSIHIAYHHKAEFQLKCGNPFYQYYADPSAMVWMNEEVGVPLKIYPTKKAFKKKLNIFKEKFYHDHDLLMTEANKFHAGQMYAAAFQSYLTVFEHHVEYLENLYMGCNFFDRNLHTRLTQLIRYIPEIQKVFVMKNEHTFYLISKMEDSVEEYDECFVSSELFEAVKDAETQLYKMVADRFSEFNKLITFKKSAGENLTSADHAVTGDVRLEKAITSLVERLSPEEIYLFHQKDNCIQNVGEQQVVYYFLVIGDGIGNTSIGDVQQSVYDRSGAKVNVVILGHRRFSIQSRLSASQDFMQDIMTPENLVYASHQYHPPVHWQHRSSEEHGDLFLYWGRMTKTVSQYFTARTASEQENTEILLLLFSHAMMRILRVYLYCSLYRYLPNFNKMYDTWKLCVYADPSLEKIEFLFDKLHPDFFRLTDSFLKYTDRSYRLKAGEPEVMDEIIKVLSEKLEHLIKEKNLTAQTT